MKRRMKRSLMRRRTIAWMRKVKRARVETRMLSQVSQKPVELTRLLAIISDTASRPIRRADLADTCPQEQAPPKKKLKTASAPDVKAPQKNGTVAANGGGEVEEPELEEDEEFDEEEAEGEDDEEDEEDEEDEVGDEVLAKGVGKVAGAPAAKKGTSQAVAAGGNDDDDD
jgi:hypothetical protein